MNGPQDLGGLQGFGPVRPEVDEPLFHEPWEARAMGVVVAMGATGSWNIDRARFCRESLPPAVYYSSSYYEIWMGGLEALLQETGLASAQEILRGESLEPGKTLNRVLLVDAVASVLSKGAPTQRQLAAQVPRFAAGDLVRTLNTHPVHHTRLPRYARGKAGKVIACHGFHVFADSNAQGQGEAPQALYTVEFDAMELWGKDTTASSVCIDCFESYLIGGVKA